MRKVVFLIVPGVARAYRSWHRESTYWQYITTQKAAMFPPTHSKDHDAYIYRLAEPSDINNLATETFEEAPS